MPALKRYALTLSGKLARWPSEGRPRELSERFSLKDAAILATNAAPSSRENSVPHETNSKISTT